MALLVLKFGGSSLATIERIQHVAGIIANTRHQGHDVVVVASAMSGETNRLIDLAYRVSDQPNLREYDALVSTGELVSCALLSMALGHLGLLARSYEAAQLPIMTDACHRKARIESIGTQALLEDLEQGCVPVVSGFQGINFAKERTTLGRGGSDITAVALAAKLQAFECLMYTDVDGVYTIDPRIVASSRRLTCLTFDEMLELSSLGSQILHIRAVEFAKKYHVPLRVLSSFTKGYGTLITDKEHSLEKATVSSIAFDANQARISLLGIPKESLAISSMVDQLSQESIDIDMMVQTCHQGAHAQDLSFTVHRDDFQQAFTITRILAKNLGAQTLETNDKVAKLSVVGVGMQSHLGAASSVFDVLDRENIEIQLTSTSKINLSVIIDEKQIDKALQALHSALELVSQS